jgi:phage gpG-like protein
MRHSGLLASARVHLSRSAALFVLALCSGCASDDPTWNAVRGDWSVFTGAPAWIEREFARSGEYLAEDGAWISGHVRRNAETTAELPDDLKAFVAKDLRRSEEAFDYSGRVLRRELQQSVENFEQDILGAPGWVGREFDRAGRELGHDTQRIAGSIEQRAEEFWPEVKRYLRVLLR